MRIAHGPSGASPAPTLIASSSAVYGKADKTPLSEEDDGVYGPNRGHDASQYPNQEEGIGRRHKKGADILGFSGQVLFITYDAFQREQLQNKPGLLWCAPDSPTGQ